MNIEPGHIYHIFNQGNNRQKIFFKKENYLFFLKKVNTHIRPFADILAWCLMPNHFHLMVLVHDTNFIVPDTTRLTTWSRQTSIAEQNVSQQLTQSIAIMLSSYTRAINKQQNSSGSLFRTKTKVLCLTKMDKISKAWYVSNGIVNINHQVSEKQYPNVCFNYILFNPVKSGIVNRNEDWEFSSYQDTIGLRNGKLISKERIEELGLVVLADP
jgi:putative transposase